MGLESCVETFVNVTYNLGRVKIAGLFLLDYTQTIRLRRQKRKDETGTLKVGDLANACQKK